MGAQGPLPLCSVCLPTHLWNRAMSRQQQQQGQSDASDFRQIGLALSGELVEDLNREHEREVQALYLEQMEIREELTRIVELMQNEIIPREKTMHDMIEKFQD